MGFHFKKFRPLRYVRARTPTWMRQRAEQAARLGQGQIVAQIATRIWQQRGWL